MSLTTGDEQMTREGETEPSRSSIAIQGLREELKAVPIPESSGIAAGIFDSEASAFITLGRVDADMIFEVGSITKTFTATLLAVSVIRRELALHEQIWTYLPTQAHPADLPDITLEDLATHTSGLPRLAPNHRERRLNPSDPYAHYRVEDMYAALQDIEVPPKSERTLSYSNFGYGILGHLLERRTETAFDVLLEERILGPLMMRGAGVNLSPDLMARSAGAHDSFGSPVPWWNLTTAQMGAGCLRMPIGDLLTWAQAHLHPAESPIGDAIEMTQQPRRAEGSKIIGLAWHWLRQHDGSQYLWHNGGTRGSGGIVALFPERRAAVAGLANFRHPRELDRAAILALARLKELA